MGRQRFRPWGAVARVQQTWKGGHVIPGARLGGPPAQETEQFPKALGFPVLTLASVSLSETFGAKYPSLSILIRRM